MKPIHLTVFAFFICFTSQVHATTWDEPWKEKVVKEAEHFVLADVISSDEHKGLTIEIIKTLGGKSIKGKVKINGFYLLDLCSISGGHGPEFDFEDVKKCYFFLKEDSAGNYQIATPTTGFDVVMDNEVKATYRHSYHQAMVPIDVYEKTMAAIFNHYHGIEYDQVFVREYIKKYLSMKPGGFEKEKINIFFAQHVAMECAYHLRLGNFYNELLPFLHDTANFHNQVSAARAMIVYNTNECKQELISMIENTSVSTFVQVICLWTLTEFKPVELKEKLSTIRKTASDDENGFGGNIMDPRVCTHFPSTKSALDKLIKNL